PPARRVARAGGPGPPAHRLRPALPPHPAGGRIPGRGRRGSQVSDPGPTDLDDLITLAVETSCDETSAAILRGEREVLGHVIFSQDIHRIYGGVVPELASRAHLRTVDDV